MGKIKKIFSFLVGKHSARQAAILTSGLTVAGKGLAYCRLLLTAYLFGASAFVDAYYVVFGAVTFVTGVMQGMVESAVLPKLVQSEETQARAIMGWTVRTLCILMTLFAALMLLFPVDFVEIFARTFDRERISYAAAMLPIILPGAVAALAIGIMTIWANYQDRFAVSNTVLAFLNPLAIPIMLVLFPLIHQYTLPAFQSAAFVILAFGMWLILRDIPLAPRSPIPRDTKRTIGKNCFLSLATSGAALIYTLIDRYFASSLPVGNVSAITYAQLIFNQPLGFLGAALSIYLVRASDAVKNKADGERQLFTTLYISWSYLFPCAIFMSVLAEPIIKLLLGYGAFDAQAVALTVPCLAVTAIGLPIIVWLFIMAKYAQAQGKLKVVAAWSYIGVAGNFILDWLFVGPYGAPGLCAATIIMWAVTVFFYLIFMAPAMLKQLIASLWKQSAVVALCVVPLFAVVDYGRIIPIIIGAPAFIGCFALLEYAGLFAKMPPQWRPFVIFKNMWRRALSKI